MKRVQHNKKIIRIITFSLFRRDISRSKPLYAPLATNKILVVSTWIVSPRSFRGEFLSGTLTIVPSSIFNIPCCTPSPKNNNQPVERKIVNYIPPTSRSWCIPGTAPILSTSSRKTIPICAFSTLNPASCNNFPITLSISSPTYPACVSVVQSHIANGTSKHWAIVWANNVLPTEKKHLITFLDMSYLSNQIL